MLRAAVNHLDIVFFIKNFDALFEFSTIIATTNSLPDRPVPLSILLQGFRNAI
jgi:hypothetical protein